MGIFYVQKHPPSLKEASFDEQNTKVTPNDYTLLVEFEHGNKITPTCGHDQTIPYSSLADLSRFKDVTVEEKAICWPEPVPDEKSIIPLRLTVDNMLFAIRG